MAEITFTNAAYASRLASITAHEAPNRVINFQLPDNPVAYDAWYQIVPRREPLSNADQVALQAAMAQHDFVRLAQLLRKTMGGVNRDVTTKQISTGTGAFANIMYTTYQLAGDVKANKVFYYLHGGALIGGTRAAVANACKYLAEQLGPEWIVYNIDYPLLPENQLTVTINQLEQLVRTLQDTNSYTQVVTGGDSSGGYLASLIARHLPTIVTQTVLLYPQLSLHIEDSLPVATDFRMHAINPTEVANNIQAMRQLLALQQPLISQENILTDDSYDSLRHADELPPTLLISAEYDGIIGQAHQLWRKIGVSQKHQYLVFAGMRHAFLDAFGYLPQAQLAVDQIVNWLHADK